MKIAHADKISGRDLKSIVWLAARGIRVTPFLDVKNKEWRFLVKRP